MPRIVLAAFIVLFLMHFAVVWESAVNLPSDDEWNVFQSSAALSLKWVWLQHNEHRIVTTKFLFWLLYHWDGWNHKTNVVLNFIIYGVTLAWLIWFAKKLAPRIPLWVILGFTAFLLSPILWMNHLIGLQVCFHFWLLFFLISTYFLFGPVQSWQRLLIGGLAAILSLYSLATGLTSVPVTVLLFCLFKISRAFSASSRQERINEVRQLVLVAMLVGGAMAVYFVRYLVSKTNRGLALPYELSFWRQLLNLVSLAFGIEVISSALGVLCLLMVTAPVIWQVWKQRGKLSAQQWTVYATVLVILATLASIAAGRAPFGIEWSKTSRYAEIGFPLIILCVISWSWVLEKKKSVERIVLAGLWVFCLVAFSDNWNFERYWQRAANRRTGALCIKAYYQQGGAGYCPNLWRSPLAGHLERAKVLNTSFYRDLTAQVQPAAPKTTGAETSSTSTAVGVLDVANCQTIGGWASHGPQSTSILKVDIYDGDRLIETVAADTFRPDVYEAGYGAYFSGYNLPTPPELKDGRPHSIRVKFAGTNVDLRATPKSLTCAPP
jgi:hypothetical protein